jgi:hypothetical protein
LSLRLHFIIFQSQRTGTNQDAKELMALVDLYTELQEEIIEANDAKYRKK